MTSLNTRVSDLIVNWLQNKINSLLQYFTDPDGPLGPLKSDSQIEFTNYITNYFNPFVLITANLVLSKLQNITTSFNSEVVNQAIIETLNSVQNTQVSAQNIINDPRLAQLYLSVQSQFEQLVKNAVFTAITYLNPTDPVMPPPGGTGTESSQTPFISDLSPSNVNVGITGAININVVGYNFTENTIIYVDGYARETLYVSPTNIKFILPVSDASVSKNLEIKSSNNTTNFSNINYLPIV